MACRPVVKKRWGLNTRILRLLFQCVFQPQLLYGSLAWAEVCAHGRLVSEMQRVLRSFCLLLTRSFPRASGEVIMAIAGVMPLQRSLLTDINMKLLMCKNGFDISEYSIRSRYRRVLEWCLARAALPYALDLDHRRRGALLPPSRYKVIDYSLVELNGMPTPDPTASDLDIYTDGSRDDGKGTGCALVVYDNRRRGSEAAFRKYQLSMQNSVFQAECGAIFKAAKYCNDTLPENNLRIRILADSHSAMQASVSPHSSSVISRAAYREMACSTHTFFLQYMRAHTGIKGNERADTLAKEACENGFYFSIPVSRSWCSSFIRKKLMQEWEESWSDTWNANICQNFESVSDFKLVHALTFIPSQLTHVITRHCNLNKYQHEIGKSRSEYCPRCERDDVGRQSETIEHVLFGCPYYAALRLRLLLCGAHHLPAWPSTIRAFFQDKDMLKILIQFTKNCGRF